MTTLLLKSVLAIIVISSLIMIPYWHFHITDTNQQLLVLTISTTPHNTTLSGDRSPHDDTPPNPEFPDTSSFCWYQNVLQFGNDNIINISMYNRSAQITNTRRRQLSMINDLSKIFIQWAVHQLITNPQLQNVVPHRLRKYMYRTKTQIYSGGGRACGACSQRRIFLVGFPKCGTLSFHHMLNEIRCKSYHYSWLEAMTKKEHIQRQIHSVSPNITYDLHYVGHAGYMMQLAHSHHLPLLSFFPSIYRSFTQMEVCENGTCIWPQMIYYKLLFAQYPGSLFILPYRNISKHINSINHWGDLRQQLINHTIPGLPMGVGADDEDLRHWIMNHYCQIEAWFLQHAPSQFLKMNIERMEQEMPRLKAFLGCNRLKLAHHHQTNFEEQAAKNRTWAYHLQQEQETTSSGYATTDTLADEAE